MEEIEKTIEQVIDTQEEEKEEFTQNVFFNETNSESVKSTYAVNVQKLINKVNSYFDDFQKPMIYDSEDYAPQINKEMILRNLESNESHKVRYTFEESKSQASDRPIYELVHLSEGEDFLTVKEGDDIIDEKIIKEFIQPFSKPEQLLKIKHLLEEAGVDVHDPIVRFEF